ncbi:hypothetical protein ACFXK0_26400 [Nocardia sp. NPDC059177]|uniref:hypothetical protein n=1 Tax=Nocardia sp. NPDC059177 TaxID=3346759 RepID=UPI0036B73D3F
MASLAVLLAVLFFARRRCAGRGGAVGALRTGFARGEISEADYRARLAVLNQPRRADAQAIKRPAVSG